MIYFAMNGARSFSFLLQPLNDRGIGYTIFLFKNTIYKNTKVGILFEIFLAISRNIRLEIYFTLRKEIFHP